jgi:hypothetical protein
MIRILIINLIIYLKISINDVGNTFITWLDYCPSCNCNGMLTFYVNHIKHD